MATAISFIDNFPVKFNNVEDSCVDYDQRDFCQLAQWSDRFEFAYHPSTTDVTVINGAFTGSLAGWTAGSGWTALGNKARLTNDVGLLEQNLNVSAGRKYKISFTVSSFSRTGSALIDVLIGGTSYSAISDGITANGIYEVYITTVSTGNLQFGASDNSIVASLDDVTVELVNEDCGIRLYDTVNETYVGNTLNANLSNAAIDTLGFSYLWSAFGVTAAGCYKIGIYDSVSGEDIISNGTFTGSAADWTITGFSSPDGWFYNSNNIKFYGTKNATITSYVDQDITSELTATATVYKITFTVSGYASGSNIPLLVNLVISGFELELASITANGTYVIMTPAIDDSLTTLLRFGKNAAIPIPNVGVDTEFIVDTVSMTSVECEESTKSECYNIRTTQPCTKLLKWTNEDVNGFNYPYYYFYNSASSFGFQWMRIECDLRSAKYEGESEKYMDSGGNQILYYFKDRKIKKLLISELPEYMHDALAIGIGHKDFYIDSDRYSVEEPEYVPEWSEKPPLLYAKSQILVSKYTQDKKSID